MRKPNHFLYLSFLLGSFAVQAQQSYVYTQENKDFYEAVKLYNEQQYAVAQMLFDRIKLNNASDEIQSESAYYSANCAIRLGQEGAEQRINQFIYEYPTSAKQSQAFIDVSNFYFTQANYSKSLQYAEKVNENILSPQQKDRFNFQKAYGYFHQKEYSKANNIFQNIDLNGKYGEQAKYYLGYISYANNDYEEAKKYFSEVAAVDKYQERMGYYQADMHFKSGNFNLAIEEGLKQLPKSNEIEQSELSKIIGEAYFNLKEYDKALPYLLSYKGKEGKWNNTDFYQLGYSYYQQKEYAKAVSEFNKIINGSDAVAQNAYYHLGESYLKLDQKTQALNAFKNATEMSFSTQIKEDAFVNYAKLSYDIGNPYRSVPEVITDFLEQYPESPYKEELNNLLVDSYISTKNFRAALDILESNRTPLNKAAYQKVTFYRGVELFNEGKYHAANEMFNRSIAERNEHRFVARATYWRGESEYALNRFGDAYQTFTTFSRLPQAKNTPEYSSVSYNLGYAAQKQNNYNDAIAHFKTFINNSSNASKKLDATLRLADGYFASKQYGQAMESYNSVLNSNSTYKDYAAFQKALAYGFIDKSQTKIEELRKFVDTYKNSSLLDDAHFELGSTYVVLEQYQKAIEVFDAFLKEHPRSVFVSRALLRQGLAYYHINEKEKAIECYKKVAEEFPGSSDAVAAVNNARDTATQIGKTAEIAAWIQSLDFYDISTTELENDLYSAVDYQLRNKNTSNALTAINEYLKAYPNGLHATKAHFNAADIYFQENKINEAKSHYENVLKRGKTEYLEPSLLRLSTIYINEKDQVSTRRILSLLENNASNDANKLFAQSNLMKVAYEEDDVATASKYAEILMKNTKIDQRIKADATAISARVAMKNNQTSEAKTRYEQLGKIASGELKAEALYHEAYFKHIDKAYEASNKLIETVVKDYSAYKFYSAKSLILLAKNFYQLNDSYQATYVLENVISGAKEYPEIVNEAQVELNRIKTEEAKRNSSVNN